jgi:transaldolase
VSDTVVVAIPFVDDGVTAMTKLVSDGVRIAAMFIATPAQALLAAKAGASYAFVPTDTLEQHGHDANATLRDTRAIFDAHEVECDLVANGAGTSRAVTASFIAGADAVAVTADTLRSLMHHPITDRSVDQMLGTLSRRPRGRSR